MVEGWYTAQIEVRRQSLETYARIVTGERVSLRLRREDGRPLDPQIGYVRSLQLARSWLHEIFVNHDIAKNGDEVENYLLQKAASLHECGHVKFTDNSAWIGSNVSQALMNMIEDGRVEIGMSLEYPLTKDLFVFMNQKILAKNAELVTVAAWILSRAKRQTGVMPLKDESSVDELLGDKKGLAVKLIDMAVMSKTEKEAVKWTRKLAELIGDKEQETGKSAGLNSQKMGDFEELGGNYDRIELPVRATVKETIEKMEEAGVRTTDAKRVAEMVEKMRAEAVKDIEVQHAVSHRVGTFEDLPSLYGEQIALDEGKSQKIARVLKSLAGEGSTVMPNQKRGSLDRKKG